MRGAGNCRYYRAIRVKELRLTADHLAKEEKERVWAERERQREEESTLPRPRRVRYRLEIAAARRHRGA